MKKPKVNVNFPLQLKEIDFLQKYIQFLQTNTVTGCFCLKN